MQLPKPCTALTAATTLWCLLAAPAQAGEPEFSLVIQDHRFTPAELRVPAGQKIRLVIENKDPTPEEFESYQLNREKVVPGNGRIVVFVGPLKPGKYEFFGEFNMATARGWLIAE
ncbi:MAG: cupredoxin domain-containing protein [Gammaproteobacteria bacterium]|nr:cupredoxin domain-containing protein [Gammaproteobacteria bacterium]